LRLSKPSGRHLGAAERLDRTFLKATLPELPKEVDDNKILKAYKEVDAANKKFKSNVLTFSKEAEAMRKMISGLRSEVLQTVREVSKIPEKRMTTEKLWADFGAYSTKML